MEYLDIYDENGVFLGTRERNVVHRDALWHKTVHCWLYDLNGNVFFQIRKDSQTLYTTASGHLQAGEDIKKGFAREIKEEIGISIDASDAEFVAMVPFVMDKTMPDGTVFKDRAFANVYVDLYEGDYSDFHMDPEEVSGLVLVNAIDTLSLFQKEAGKVEGRVLKEENGIIIESVQDIDFSEFLVNQHETALTKYGDILRKVIELTSK